MFHSITAKKYWGDRDFLKRFLIIALPIAVQNGITNFVNMLDNVMVGQLGTHQMNGVSIVNQIFLIPFLCLFGAMAGAGIFTAQFYGSGDSEGIKYTFRFKMGIGAVVVTAAICISVLFGGNLIELFEDGSAHLVDAGNLAGSTLKVNQGLRNLVEKAGVPWQTAINSCTINPARLIGMEASKGSITAGKDADLVVLGDDYSVQAAYVCGERCY